MTLAWALALTCLVLVVLNLISDGIAIWHSKPRTTPLPPAPTRPPSQSCAPCCGIDNFCEDTLGSSFKLDYPRYEVIFGVARSNDPVIPGPAKADRGQSAGSGAADHRRRTGERQSEAQQLCARLGSGASRLDYSG